MQGSVALNPAHALTRCMLVHHSGLDLQHAAGSGVQGSVALNPAHALTRCMLVQPLWTLAFNKQQALVCRAPMHLGVPEALRKAHDLQAHWCWLSAEHACMSRSIPA